MTLLAKLTSYSLLNRLAVLSTLWLVLPKRMDTSGLVLLVSLFVLAGLVDLVYVHYLLRPLAILVNRKLRIIPEAGQADFPPLSTKTLDLIQLDAHINELMRRFSLRFECEKVFTTYASHELLTPIAVLRNRIENLIADEQTPSHIIIRLVESQHTLLRLSKIVQMLLRLARIENHQYLKNETVSIRAVLREVLSDFDDFIVLKYIRVELVFDEDILMDKANHSLIYTLLLGLISNAIRHNTEKGQLVIRRGQIGNVPILTVRDSGPGMTPEQVASLTQYGHPAKSSGDSTGIGLQLLLTIATFHHIDLSVDPQLSPGTRITLTFP